MARYAALRIRSGRPELMPASRPWSPPPVPNFVGMALRYLRGRQAAARSRVEAVHPPGVKRPQPLGRVLSGSGLALVVFACVVLLPARRAFDPLAALALLALTIGALRVKLHLPSGHWTSPVQLVFVPMLFLLPVNVVPAVVVIAMVTDRLWAGVGRWPERTLTGLENSWFTVAPAAIIALANPGLNWASAPVLAAAFTAQLVVDAAVPFFVEVHAARQLPAFVGDMALTLGIDGLLTPVALLAASQLRTSPVGAAVVFCSLAGLVSLLARERQVRQSQTHAALTDSLTGLANRRLLEEASASALAGALREGGQCSVLMLDLDRFKALNDGYGHHAGDLALREVASRLREALRASDMAARVGGDEFAVLLQQGGPAQAATVIARISDAFTRRFELGALSYELGVSVGAAHFPADGASMHELLGVADSRMYRDKHSAARVTGAAR